MYYAYNKIQKQCIAIKQVANSWEEKKKEAKDKSHQSRQACAIWNHKEVSKPREGLS